MWPDLVDQSRNEAGVNITETVSMVAVYSNEQIQLKRPTVQVKSFSSQDTSVTNMP